LDNETLLLKPSDSKETIEGKKIMYHKVQIPRITFLRIKCKITSLFVY
jgi:hypothetical protein